MGGGERNDVFVGRRLWGSRRPDASATRRVRKARGKCGGKVKTAAPALPTRAERLSKAARRMRRVRMFKRGRRRLFASCMLPAAAYVAEPSTRP